MFHHTFIAKRFQWGHDFSAVDTWSVEDALEAMEMFQWGHDFSAVDTDEDVQLLKHFITVSMGPRLFSRGYGWPRKRQSSSGRCFNGATTFQPWIHHETVRRSGAP